MADLSVFGVPTRVHFGVGARDRIPQIVAEAGYRRVLLICDPGLIGTEIFEAISRGLSGFETALFTGIDPEPKDKNVVAGLAACRDLQAEAIVVLGGGSAIDVAKAVAIVMTNGGVVADFEGDRRFDISPLPIIAVPTTAGTGSEVSGAAVITDTARNVKMAIRHPLHAPAPHAILDPLAVSTTPRHVGVYSGIDAFAHALESYVSRLANPFSDAINRHAMRLISANIRAYIDNPRDEVAALNMLCGSSMGAMSFGTTGTGNIHCMAMSLGSFHAMPHGLCIALLLPHVAEFNMQAVPHRFADVARDMGLDVGGLSDIDAAGRGLEAMRRMNSDLGIPSGLAEAGVPPEVLGRAADRCFQIDYNRWNPRFTTRDEYYELFERAM